MKKNHLFIQVVFCLFCTYGFAVNDDTLKLKKIKPEYEVLSLEGINTKNSEFAAVPYLNTILFVTNQPIDLVNNESFDVNGYPYVDVFSTAITNNKANKIVPFSKKINGPFHDGPISFNHEQTQLYLTRVEYINKRTKKFINKAKLFIFEKKENEWLNPVSFKYNNDAYSIGHASVSKDGNSLFFVSDMPGGKGGKDIYVCKKNGEEWGVPENLGTEINTEGDEEFPFIRDDGTLFFSSNGHKGFGAFDIFSASLWNDKWFFIRNEGVGINTEADDFGMVFTDSIHGYFTSNRKGGVGLDDIYKFTFLQSGTSVFATLLLTENINNPAKNTLVYLMSNKGNILDSTKTNEKGFFSFKNLESNKEYMASVNPNEIEFNGKVRFYLANTNGEIVRVSHPYKKNNFVFEHLPIDKSSLSEIYTDEDLSLSGALSYGNNPSTFIKKAQLYLINTFGDVVDTAYTNDLGRFVFKNLTSKQDYIVGINDSSLHLPIGTKVILTDKNGNKLKSFVVDKNDFKFKLLSHEKSVMSDLATDEELNFKFNNCTYGQDKLVLKELISKKIYLLNSKGQVIDSLITDSKGKFKFKNLDVDKDYMISVATDDVSFIAKKEYYLVNSHGNIVRVSYPFKGKKFVFKNIPIDSLSLQEIIVDDKLFLAGNLRFGPRGENPIKNTRIHIVNSKNIVVDSVVTNEFGCFSFRNLPTDQNYIMSINETDMNLPFNTKIYLTDKNGKVVKVFVVGKDAFKYEILAVEKNIMSDLETDDSDLTMKLNGYVYDRNKKAVANATVILYDANGKQSQTIKTDSTGNFYFHNTKTGFVNRIEIISLNINDSILYIADSKGIIRKKLLKNSEGKFEYQLLDIDKSTLGDFTFDDPWLKVVDMLPNSESLTIIESILYATNDYKIDSVGIRILDKTINVLNANPKLMIELSSHTDSRSNDKYNLKLSNKRAQFAVDYIVSKGINKSRLKAIGYGETKLLNKCANNINCSESEHAQNRRTEFKITYKQ